MPVNDLGCLTLETARLGFSLFTRDARTSEKSFCCLSIPLCFSYHIWSLLFSFTSAGHGSCIFPGRYKLKLVQLL